MRDEHVFTCVDEFCISALQTDLCNIGEGMGASAFSRDGTVLAVACRTCVTLWDPITLTRLGLLPIPAQSLMTTTINELEFVPDTNYLVRSAQ